MGRRATKAEMALRAAEEKLRDAAVRFASLNGSDGHLVRELALYKAALDLGIAQILDNRAREERREKTWKRAAGRVAAVIKRGKR